MNKEENTIEPHFPDSALSVRVGEIVDWDDLEEALAEGKFKAQSDMKELVRGQFKEAGYDMTPALWQEVCDGLWPDDREVFYALPARRWALNEDLVRAARETHAEGGISIAALAEECGVSRQTMSDVINRKTWKEVA